MTRDFEQVRAAFGASLPGRFLSRLQVVTRASWGSSHIGAAARSLDARIRTTSKTTLVRAAAAAALTFAVTQPLLMGLMPRTVAPATPWPAFVVIAILAAVAAWQAETVVATWPASRLARWLRRYPPPRPRLR